MISATPSHPAAPAHSSPVVKLTDARGFTFDVAPTATFKNTTTLMNNTVAPLGSHYLVVSFKVTNRSDRPASIVASDDQWVLGIDLTPQEVQNCKNFNAQMQQGGSGYVPEDCQRVKPNYPTLYDNGGMSEGSQQIAEGSQQIAPGEVAELSFEYKLLDSSITDKLVLGGVGDSKTPIPVGTIYQGS